MTDSSKPRRRSNAHEGARGPPEPQTTAEAATAPARPAPDPIDAATLDEAFVKALEADFIAYGKSAIVALRAEKPTDYMKIVAALHAKGVGDEVDPSQEMSDAELDRCIEELAQRTGFEIRARVPARREGEAADDGAAAD